MDVFLLLDKTFPQEKFLATIQNSFLGLFGEFQGIKDVGSVIVSFFGNDVPITVGQIASIKESLEDEASRSFHNGKSSIFVKVFVSMAQTH